MGPRRTPLLRPAPGSALHRRDAGLVRRRGAPGARPGGPQRRPLAAAVGPRSCRGGGAHAGAGRRHGALARDPTPSRRVSSTATGWPEVAGDLAAFLALGLCDAGWIEAHLATLTDAAHSARDRGRRAPAHGRPERQPVPAGGPGAARRLELRLHREPTVRSRGLAAEPARRRRPRPRAGRAAGSRTWRPSRRCSPATSRRTPRAPTSPRRPTCVRSSASRPAPRCRGRPVRWACRLRRPSPDAAPATARCRCNTLLPSTA